MPSCALRVRTKIARTTGGRQTKPTVAMVGIVRATQTRADARVKKVRATVDFFDQSTDLAVATKASNRFGSKQFDQKSP